MDELEETFCEIRRTIQLQNLNWHTFKFHDFDSKSVESCRLSNPHLSGGFLDNVNYAWLSCGSKLIIFNAKTGISISYKTFRERISCVSPFPSQSGQLPLLLVGLDNSANKLKESSGTICVFDCISSQILRSIRMPAGVEKLCVINGGSEWEKINENRVDYRFLKNHGLACVALRNLDYFMIDLRRNRWESNQFLASSESNTSEIHIIDDEESQYKYKSEEHAVLNLINDHMKQRICPNHKEFESSKLFQDSFTSVILYSEKIGCVIAGCLGRILIWQTNCISWISPLVDEEMTITHITLLEPADDPRPFYYLWVSYENKSRQSPPILKMYAILFKKKCLTESAYSYLKMEAEPSLKFELKLQKIDRIINLIPILRVSNSEQSESIEKPGENSLLLISVEGKIILFDLNQWYKEQMPRSVGECHNVNSILTIYHTKSQVAPEHIINCAYIPSTLKEFSWTQLTSPDEFYYPYSLSLDWIELSSKQITFWMTRGLQAHLLRKIATSGSTIISQPSKIFNRCVTAGLIPSSPDNSFINDIDGQRDSLLTLCLEQRSTLFLLKCAKEWYDNDSTYMYSAFVRWSIQRASDIKLTAHQLCYSLFDQSGHSIGEAEIKILRFLSQQMECLCNVVEHLPKTEDIKQQCQAFYRISMYLEILLWFYDVGLLPEVQNMEGEILTDSFNLRIPYPVAKLSCIYNEKRERYYQETETNEGNKEILFIDELISRECPALRLQWEQERNETYNGDKYPPPSLQSLIRSCLIDCYYPDSNEIENKHQIIIYLLMDLVMLLHNTYSSVGQLIKYPSAFKLSPSLIKLTHALWFLDHEDYQGFLDIMIGQLVLDSDIKNWHHEFILRTLLQCNQNKIASVYIRIRKPPLPSIDDQGTFVTLSIEHGLVQSIFHKKCLYHNKLLIKFFRACQLYGKLGDVLHLILNTEEEKFFMQFLEQQKYEETQLLYYLQRCRYIEANNILQSDQSLSCMKKKKKMPVFFTTFQALNTTLPEITQRITENFIKSNKRNNLRSSLPRPMSYVNNSISKRETYESAVENVNDIFFCKNLSRIPFLSAPCLSLETIDKITDSNCVRFAKNVQLYREKRSLNQIITSEDFQNDGELKKRCKKVTASNNGIGDNSTGMISLFPIRDTPLIKRKHQIMNTTNTPCETPQSILKIRQMIQNSSSSSGSLSSLKKNKISDKEKKRRQIRFNIYQSMINGSIDESLDNIKTSSQNQVDTLNNTLLIENDINVMPEHEICGESEGMYPNLNNSTKSLYEESILTNTSLYDFDSIDSGSKPHLNRKDFSESCQTPFQTSVNHSLKSNEDLNASIYDSAEKTHNLRSFSPSTSIYASTVLSASSSFDVTSIDTPIKDDEHYQKILSPITVPSNSLMVNNLNINKNSENENDTNDKLILWVDYNKTKTDFEEINTNDVYKNTVTSSTSHELNNSTNYEFKLEKSNKDKAAKNAVEIGSKIDKINSNINNVSYLSSLNNCNDKLNPIFHTIEINNSREIIADCYKNFNVTADESDRSLENDAINIRKTDKKLMSFTNFSEISKIIFAGSSSITDETDQSIEPTQLTKDINMSQFIPSGQFQQSLNFDNIEIVHNGTNKLLDSKFLPGKCENSNDSNETSQFKCKENSTHFRVTRSHRASSVIPIIEKFTNEVSDNAKVEKVKDFTKQESSLVIVTSTSSSECFKSKDLSSTKKGRSRRSRSLTKDVVTNTKDSSKLLNNSFELTIRRSTRHSASEQKKLISSEKKTDLPLTPQISELEEESTGQFNKIKKKTKNKKGTTVIKNSELTKKRFPTLSDNDCDQAFEYIKTRKTSISNNTAQDKLIEKPVSDNQPLELSGSKKSSNPSLKHKTQLRPSETTEFFKISEENQSEYVPLAKRTRSASMSKENSEERLSKRRCSDLSKKKNADENSMISQKSDNVSNDKNKNTNRTENSTKSTTRRKRSTSDEMINKLIKIQDMKDNCENSFDIIKPYVTSITPIPEENEITDGLENQTTVTRKSRQRRAMSVDLTPTASKRQSREFSQNTIFKNSEKEKEFNTYTENDSIAKNLRRSKRAKSETKELKQTIVLDRLKQTSKRNNTKKNCND
ncbi:protein ELYS [Cotesia glomerata]|uniref:ELYS-like domain-containing protein n=1 Tax=Cotesia glomerata TaxID=32391 RepID=A0AAV7IGW8_COTGL|nr:protein ELYS [Cotesia glomerata]XP_044578546.1 protein ELYS [Cotesia glomerata]KAH0549639.1 hypothetical protein KQX54_011546 [Cotesia glomerata]